MEFTLDGDSGTMSTVAGQANMGMTAPSTLSTGEGRRWSVCLALGLSPQSLCFGMLGNHLFKLGEVFLHHPSSS